MGFTNFRVTCQRGKRAKPGNVVTRPPIQKAEPEQISTQEFPKRSHGEIKPAGHSIRRQTLTHKRIGIAPDLFQLPIDAFIAVMEEVGAKPAHRSLNLKSLVNLQTYIFRCAFAPEPEHPIRVPITMANPPATVIGTTRKFERGVSSVES